MKSIVSLLFLLLLISTQSFAQPKIEDLKVNTTITGFKLTDSPNGVYTYTHPPSADATTITPSYFTIFITDNMTMKDAVASLEYLLETAKQNGYKVSNQVKKDTSINGHTAFILSYSAIDEANGIDPQQNFSAVVLKDNVPIIFTSTDLDKGVYFEKFKQTFYTLKF